MTEPSAANLELAIALPQPGEAAEAAALPLVQCPSFRPGLAHGTGPGGDVLVQHCLLAVSVMRDVMKQSLGLRPPRPAGFLPAPAPGRDLLRKQRFVVYVYRCALSTRRRFRDGH